MHAVKPGQVRAALFNAFERHGVPLSTSESIWYDLTTGNDPRPEHLPETFAFKGVKLIWPAGRHSRVVTPVEVRTFNTALHASTYTIVDGKKKHTVKANLLDGDDTAEMARNAYTFLWHRTQQPDFDNTTIVEDKITLVVAEATQAREPVQPDFDAAVNIAAAAVSAGEPEAIHPCRKTKAVHEAHLYVRARKLTRCEGVAPAQADTRTDLEREIDDLMADLDSIG